MRGWKLFGVRIFKEKAGVISPGPLWIAFHSCYMYDHTYLLGLFWQMLTEWKHDKNLVG